MTLVTSVYEHVHGGYVVLELLYRYFIILWLLLLCAILWYLALGLFTLWAWAGSSIDLWRSTVSDYLVGIGHFIVAAFRRLALFRLFFALLTLLVFLLPQGLVVKVLAHSIGITEKLLFELLNFVVILALVLLIVHVETGIGQDDISGQAESLGGLLLALGELLLLLIVRCLDDVIVLILVMLAHKFLPIWVLEEFVLGNILTCTAHK